MSGEVDPRYAKQAKLIRLGVDRLARLASQNEKTVRINLVQLQTKLAIELVMDRNPYTNIPRLWRVWSFESVLERRERAGLHWVRKTKGAEFVADPDLGFVH